MGTAVLSTVAASFQLVRASGIGFTSEKRVATGSSEKLLPSPFSCPHFPGYKGLSKAF